MSNLSDEDKLRLCDEYVATVIERKEIAAQRRRGFPVAQFRGRKMKTQIATGKQARRQAIRAAKVDGKRLDAETMKKVLESVK